MRLNQALRRRDVNELGKVLESGSGVHRFAAAAGLRHMPTDQAEETLFQGLRDPSRWVRQAALGSLISLDPDRPCEPILSALRSAPGEPDPLSAHEFFGVGLFRLPSLDSTPHLGRFVNDGDPSIRSLAAIAIGEAEGPAPLRYLRQLLRDGDRTVRDDAIEAAGKVGDASLLPCLEEAARSRREDRRAARRAIKRIERRAEDAR